MSDMPEPRNSRHVSPMFAFLLLLAGLGVAFIVYVVLFVPRP